MENNNSNVVDKDKTNIYLFISIFIVIVLHNIPATHMIMYPFNLLATWIHEMGHGIMAEIMGGNFNKLVLNPDTSGYASFSHPVTMSDFSKSIIASAGYMGTSFFGALMLWVRHKDRVVTFFATALGVIMALSLIIYTRSLTGWFFGVPFTLFLLFIGWKKNSDLNKFFYNFLASQIALNAILDINILFKVNGQVMHGMSMKSDAVVVSELLFFPPWFWAGLWLIISVILFVGALWKPLKQR